MTLSQDLCSRIAMLTPDEVPTSTLRAAAQVLLEGIDQAGMLRQCRAPALGKLPSQHPCPALN